MMLALIHNDQILAEVFPGSGFTLPNSDRVSPAYAGWQNEAGYSLHEIQEADPAPAGKHVVGTSVKMIAGVPKYVHELEDIPPVDLADYAAQRRWEKEVGGILVGGMAIATDDRSKTMIVGARVKAENDPGFTTPWKGANGEFITIDAATIIAISDAVLAHVAACFALESAVLGAIAAGDITTTAEIDAAFA